MISDKAKARAAMIKDREEETAFARQWWICPYCGDTLVLGGALSLVTTLDCKACDKRWPALAK
jgi:hypothetical protein